MVASPPPWRVHLDAELAALDVRLALALDRRRRDGLDTSDDPLAGVVVRPSLAAAALAARRADAAGPAWSEPDRRALDDLARPTALGRVWERFALSSFERFVTVLAVAPEVDARYRPLLALVQDDVAATRPTVGLALELWAGPGLDAGRWRAPLAADSVLAGAGLVSLRATGAGLALSAHVVEVDEWLVEHALGVPRIDVRLRASVRVLEPRRGGPCGAVHPGTPVVYVGDDTAAILAEAEAGTSSRVLLAAGDAGVGTSDAVLLLAREARAAGLALTVGSAVIAGDHVAARRLEDLAVHLPVTVVADPTDAMSLPAAWHRIEVGRPDNHSRARRWTERLSARELDADANDVAAVAFSHALPFGRIDAAVDRLPPPNGSSGVSSTQLQAVARSVSVLPLGHLARRVESGAGWDDLVLPDEALQRLRDIAATVAGRRTVLEVWGFGAQPGGHGINLLFAGPSGTGKTLAASVIAHETGYELYACDLSQVVDKYLGETEKRLDQVLRDAEAANCVLLFDEADALFGRRAEVRDARDRYANLEVAYLLQRIEQHRGVTILATNLGQHLDEAFARRLHHRVDFHPPDSQLRRRLWKLMFPAQAPMASDVDFDLVADQVELAGGSIRNAALSAAYLAAADARPIAQRDIVVAVLRELEKLGRRPGRAELGDLARAL